MRKNQHSPEFIERALSKVCTRGSRTLESVATELNMPLRRTLADLPADLLFEDDEWRAAFILNKKAALKTVPALNTVIRLIAQLGGFLGRKSDGEPGAKTIWLGMRDVAVFVQGARFARENGVTCV
jgi:hypothetical protein